MDAAGTGNHRVTYSATSQQGHFDFSDTLQVSLVDQGFCVNYNALKRLHTWLPLEGSSNVVNELDHLWTRPSIRG